VDELHSEQKEILRFVHQSQHEEALAHRQSISNAFSLSLTGLMVILGGVISVEQKPSWFRWGIPIAVIFICWVEICFMKQQRRETEKAMEILIQIERQLGLYEKDRYLPDKPVFLEEFSTTTSVGPYHRPGLKRRGWRGPQRRLFTAAWLSIPLQASLASASLVK